MMEFETRSAPTSESLPADRLLHQGGEQATVLGPSFEYDSMTTTAKAVREFGASLSAAGKPMPAIVLSSHVEAKLAAWALMLTEIGCAVCVCPSNPASAVPGQLTWLRERDIRVLEWDVDTSPTADFWSQLGEFSPDLILDDGARLIKSFQSGKAPPVVGAVEFTTSGHQALSETGGELTFPIFDLGMSYCKYDLGNVFGTGWSALAAIVASTNVYMALRRVLVIGYGAVGRGVAAAAAKMGARVLVVDHRVRNQARARLDGFEVGTLEELVVSSDVVITCSGSVNVLSSEMISRLPDGAIIANVGCFAEEIDVQGLRRIAGKIIQRDRQIESFCLSGGKHVHLLANGELVNLAIGRGWPIELIDLCFALTTLCFRQLVEEPTAAGLHKVPEALEERALQLFVESP